ncbi:Polygalacturonase [compost metagenome]
MTSREDFLIHPKPGEETGDIQAQIDAAFDAGGGRVTLLAGLHVTAGLRLKSGVELHLAKDAVLAPLSDYEAYRSTTVSVIAESSDRAMIVATQAENIAITGPGVIEAGGENFIAGNDEVMGTWIPAALRPRVVVFESCRGVRLEDIRVSGSPMWTLHMIDCEDIHFRQVDVVNDRRLPNTDGIVLDACRRALIEDCSIFTADDGVVLKTSAGPDGKAVGRCEAITVRRCEVSSMSCALKLGTESFGDFRNILFEDCKVSESNRALGLFSRDGGEMSNIRFSRIAVDCHETPDGFWGSGEALTVTVVDRRPDQLAGKVENLTVEDLTGCMEGAINLVSISRAGIHNVQLQRIGLAQQSGKLGTGTQYDIRPTNADIAPSPDAAGRANAWTRGEDGKIVGLEDYPGGMPAIYLDGVREFSTHEVEITRTAPLPKGWNIKALVDTASLPEGSR